MSKLIQTNIHTTSGLTTTTCEFPTLATSMPEGRPGVRLVAGVHPRDAEERSWVQMRTHRRRQTSNNRYDEWTPTRESKAGQAQQRLHLLQGPVNRQTQVLALRNKVSVRPNIVTCVILHEKLQTCILLLRIRIMFIFVTYDKFYFELDTIVTNF